MAAKPLRFLHAANTCLDAPLHGVGPVSDEIREIVQDATLTAFDRIVSTAIDKDVDALLITGNTFDAHCASLAAEVALRDGFDRLADRNIPVFVAPGQTDPATSWRELPRLPDNVTVFGDTDEPPVDLTDHGQLLATLLPVTAETEIEPQELDDILRGRTNSKGGRPFVIGLLLTDREAAPHERSKLNPARYAALDWLVCPAGTNTDLFPLTDGHIHSQASPQGLCSAETGARGVTLLEVDSHRKTRRLSIPVAPVRWERIVQPVDGVRGRDDLLERMLAQLERVPDFKGELVRIIDWQLDRTSGAAHGWESESVAQELAAALTELTDQPDGLRYVHHVRPMEPDLTLIDPTHREVLTELLLALERRSSIDHSAHARWLTDAKVGDLLSTGRSDPWTDSISPELVKTRAKELSWKWFASVGKK